CARAWLGPERRLPRSKPKPRVASVRSATTVRGFPGWLPAAGARRQSAILDQHRFRFSTSFIERNPMPLLTLKTHSKPYTIKINLDSNTLERLKNYCVYAHGDLDSAVREALIYVFDRDKDFKAMEQQLRQQQ